MQIIRGREEAEMEWGKVPPSPGTYLGICVSDHQKLEREARICRLLKHPNIGELWGGGRGVGGTRPGGCLGAGRAAALFSGHHGPVMGKGVPLMVSTFLRDQLG